MSTTQENLAYAMFQRRCELDEAVDGMPEIVWELEEKVREFWEAEAKFVMDNLNIDNLEACDYCQGHGCEQCGGEGEWPVLPGLGV